MNHPLRLLFSIFFISLCFNADAQFGRFTKKPKKVVTTKKSNTSSNTTSNNNSKEAASPAPASSSSSSVARNKDGTPKYDSESQLYKSYSTAKQNLKYAKGVIEGIEWKQNPEKAQKNASSYLEKAKKGLDFLNQQDSEKNQSYLQQFNDDYAAMHKKCKGDTETFTKIKNFQQNLKAYANWVQTGFIPEGSTLEYSRTAYIKTRDAYKNEASEKFNSDKEAQRNVTNIDNFFEKSVYQQVEKEAEKAAVIFEAMYKRQLYLWEDKPNYILHADDYLKKLQAIKKRRVLADRALLLEDPTSAETLLKKLDKEITLLDDYVSSGQLEKAKAEHQQARIDNVRLDKKGMSNSSYEKLALDRTFSDGRKILRAVITSTDWLVAKNSLDVPKHKYLWVSIAVKEADGTCYKANGEIRRDYEGGGKYGSSKFLFGEREEEMNCNNIHK